MDARILLGVAVVALLAGAMPAAAQGEDVSLTIEAMEVCDGDEAFCLEVVEGDLESVAPGDRVTVTYRNEGNTTHNLYVVASGDADPTHADTSSDNATAGTDGDVEPGAEATFDFVAPEEASGLYYWCDVAGHEPQGMWLEAEYATSGNETANETEPAGAPFGGGGGGGDETPTEGAPSLGALFVAAASVGIIRARRRAA